VAEQNDWRQAANKSIERIRKGDVTVQVIGRDGKAIPNAEVQLEQTNHDFWFGTCLNCRFFQPDGDSDEKSNYLRIVKDCFNSAVPENAMKWYSTEWERGKTTYQTMDRMLAWCESNNIRVRGHCIFWDVDEYNMKWLHDLPAEELRKEVERRAREIPRRYRGRIGEYDLNNEMLHANFFRRKLGEDIILDMFRWAAEADPKALLYLNDYGILSGGISGAATLSLYEAQITQLQQKGVKIGGIGCQGHFGNSMPDPQWIRTAFDRLGAFGVPIKITEYDYESDDDEAKAQALETVYRVAFSHPSVNGILMWGFWSKSHWKPKAAIFREDFEPRPAAILYRKLVKEEWHSSLTARTNDRGEASARVFYGSYRVRAATPGGQTVEKSFVFPKGAKEPFAVRIEMRNP